MSKLAALLAVFATALLSIGMIMDSSIIKLRQPRSMIIQISARLFTFALFWWFFTAGSLDSWPIGVPTILVSSWVSMTLIPHFPCSIFGVIKFIPFFIWHSLRGAIDVAWRALHPGLCIDPVVLDYPLRLPRGLSQVFMANTVSLLPGTLSLELQEKSLKVHILTSRQRILAEIATVENFVAGVFAIDLERYSGAQRDETI